MEHTVKHAIGEIDVVAFTEAIDKDEGTGRWPGGTEGTVVIDLGDHKMVESLGNDRGETLDMPVRAGREAQAHHQIQQRQRHPREEPEAAQATARDRLAQLDRVSRERSGGPRGSHPRAPTESRRDSLPSPGSSHQH